MNTGTLITYDRDALRRWQSKHRREFRKQATASDFSATINRLAQMFPGKVQTH